MNTKHDTGSVSQDTTRPITPSYPMGVTGTDDRPLSRAERRLRKFRPQFAKVDNAVRRDPRTQWMVEVDHDRRARRGDR